MLKGKRSQGYVTGEVCGYLGILGILGISLLNGEISFCILCAHHKEWAQHVTSLWTWEAGDIGVTICSRPCIRLPDLELGARKAAKAKGSWQVSTVHTNDLLDPMVLIICLRDTVWSFGQAHSIGPRCLETLGRLFSTWKTPFSLLFGLAKTACPTFEYKWICDPDCSLWTGCYSLHHKLRHVHTIPV